MRFRFKIRTLLIATAILALPACYYGLTLQEYRSEAAALKQLEKDGWAVSWLSKSEINKEGKSVRARASRALRLPFNFFFGTEYSERCTQLVLAAGNSASNLKALESLRFLKRLDLQDDGLDCDRFVDTFLKLDRLESIEFFSNNINFDSYKRLTDAGIEVRHYGLKDYQPEKDFLRYGNRCHPIDLDKSYLSVRLAKSDKGPRFSVAIRTLEFPIYMRPSPSLQYTIEQVIPGTIADLTASGEIIETKTEDDEGSNFYDGIHQGVVYHSLQLISHNDTGLRIKWGFKTSTDEQFGEVDVELPIKKVAVDVDADVAEESAREEAIELFSQHFELAKFQEPVLDKKKNRFIFTAK